MPALAPNATVDARLQAARWPDAREPVLVVGHQPALGQVAAYLLAGQTDEWVMKKAGIWWLRSREKLGEPAVVLHAVVSAELV